MKTLLLVCTTLALAFTGHAAEKPGIDALRAAKVATDFLAKMGGDAPYITSISIDPGAIFNGHPTWVVKWSKPIEAEGNKEVGVRVKNDGTVVRLIEAKGSRSKRQPAALDIR
jgi:hypothetical protein